VTEKFHALQNNFWQQKNATPRHAASPWRLSANKKAGVKPAFRVSC